MKDAPEKEKEKVKEKEKLTLSERDTEPERDKRLRPRKKQNAALLAASTHPGPHENPPATLGTAKQCQYWKGYEEAIESELSQLEKNNTWSYVDRNSLPHHTNILRSKFVFDIKRGGVGSF